MQRLRRLQSHEPKEVQFLRRREGKTLPARVGARLTGRREKGNPVEESASKRPDVDNKPGAAAREASGDDPHSAFGGLRQRTQ